MVNFISWVLLLGAGSALVYAVYSLVKAIRKRKAARNKKPTEEGKDSEKGE